MKDRQDWIIALLICILIWGEINNHTSKQRLKSIERKLDKIESCR